MFLSAYEIKEENGGGGHRMGLVVSGCSALGLGGRRWSWWSELLFGGALDGWAGEGRGSAIEQVGCS